MANNNGGYREPRSQGGPRENYGYNHYQSAAPRVVEPKALPDDFVDVAERHMSRCFRSITTSKIRNLLSLVIDCYQAESRRTDEKITPESADALTNMRIRVVYEMGRDDRNVGQFVRETELLQYLAGIRDDRKALIRFYHYMEALVAYHKYMGGREG
ncbi:MAG: type III-A CRISPR-associated protein Csm2 [Oscillospiraceae bacterium]|nr:type III-A CRISPR-associated protein Csm2 [Oscillospiraceae bacterium]